METRGETEGTGPSGGARGKTEGTETEVTLRGQTLRGKLDGEGSVPINV